MSDQVKYLIAQYQPDPLRKEPRNVGVIARNGSRTAARFWGENELGELDGRRLRRFPFPDVYRQWVDYWREESQTANSLEALLTDNSSHYHLIRGGHVFDVGADPVEQVADYLFKRFVSEEGFAAAIDDSDESGAPTQTFEEELQSAFRELSVLAKDASELWVPHPIVPHRPFQGRSRAVHKPDFSQENGQLYIIETFDFSYARSSRLREHAGASAFMFADLKGTTVNRGVEAISVVKMTEKSRAFDHVVNSLWMLEAESQIIDWNAPGDRSAFLREREEVAKQKEG